MDDSNEGMEDRNLSKKDLEEMNIDLKFEDIRMMKKENFSKLIKSRIENLALEYLIKKRGSKGKEILYKRLEMSEYLMPHNEKLSIKLKILIPFKTTSTIKQEILFLKKSTPKKF